MQKWERIVTEGGMGAYVSGIQSLYDLYSEYEGFTDELFMFALGRSMNAKTEKDFFFILIPEIVRLMNNESHPLYLLPNRGNQKNNSDSLSNMVECKSKQNEKKQTS